MPTDPRRAPGFTIVELMVTVILISLLSTVLTRSIADLSQAQRFTVRRAEASHAVGRVLATIVRDVQLSDRLFAESDDPGSYLRVLDYPRRQVLRDSRFAVRTSRGQFEKDSPDARETGNMVLLARRGAPAVVMLRNGDDEPRPVRIDTARFVLYYLSGSRGRLDLGRWVSVPVAQLDDIELMEDPDARTRLLVALYDGDVRYVWDRRERGKDGLRSIRSDGDLRGVRRIAGDPERIVPSLFARQRVVIAENGSQRTPMFARPHERFPGGFEVKIDGSTTSALVLIRLVVVDPRQHGRIEMVRVAACRSR